MVSVARWGIACIWVADAEVRLGLGGFSPDARVCGAIALADSYFGSDFGSCVHVDARSQGVAAGALGTMSRRQALRGPSCRPRRRQRPA